MFLHEIDRGWSWVVVVTSFIAHMLIYGVSWTYGIFNMVFLDEFKGNAGATAWIGSINTACLLVIGPFASVLTNRFGCRPVMAVGGVIAAAGYVASSFATDIYHLYFSFGIMVGCGLGIAYIPAIVSVTEHFHDKRTIATGIAVSGTGFGMLVYPILFQWLLEKYVWRQALLITSGITLNLCVCAAAIFPLKRDFNVNIVKPTKTLSVSMLKKPNYTKLCINNLLFCIALSIAYVHLPAYAHSVGHTEQLASMLISVIGVSNCVGRITFGFMAHHPKVSAQTLYVSAFGAIGVATFFVPASTYYGYIVAYCVILGFFSATFGALLPPLLVQFLGLHRMANGYGFLLVYEAVGTLFGAPAAGMMYDAVHTYTSSFYMAGAFFVASALVMLIPVPNDSKKRNLNNELHEVPLCDVNGVIKKVSAYSLKKSRPKSLVPPA
ncbi:PREDICTED: monocarboxylate transporter 13-like [Priapulus caudatus]|uniref:Monocarboxylate transporter 13-like n=1 Tax=Priapulus caudatus TaxID=37621 RepID=A0ABM1E5F1_PRICU|nr:PREDICTED: monocarboxylate transporter 13-like [Priapulus caudatus]XP_014667423.1 PREDICTED: monocarboxylate transporter 13-like [Priapulus caudatus]XP_014667424.1 PREDICTED: monocarboxylate transporter 13-like [Priapulus caudatus]XP_014667425.1 PREDICTED: monocarboxylate transporter 13-like [Priapulus caudatus]